MKHKTDQTVLNNRALLDSQDYFSTLTKRTILEELEQRGIKDLQAIQFFNSTLVDEYFYERKAA